MLKIAVIMTCHNRYESTRRCIESLSKQVYSGKYCYKHFICDDGSIDNTSEYLKSLGTSTEIIQGDGQLYWTKGMAKAIEMAEAWEPDFYLMVNDDVLFFPNMMQIMMNAYLASEETAAISGALVDPDTGECSYGGISKKLGRKTYRVVPDGKVQKCYMANWNCFLLPKELYLECGKIDNYYQHAFADYDYSYRINKKKHSIYLTETYVGSCKRNSIKNTSADPELPFWGRVHLLHRRTESPPKSRWHFYWKQNKVLCIFRFLVPYFAIGISCINHRILSLRRKDDEFEKNR